MQPITISVTVQKDIETVWDYWNNPAHIMGWAFASPDWYCPHAENNLVEGGQFKTTMAAKDGSVSFDIIGTYTTVVPFTQIDYTMEDGRKVSNHFEVGDGLVQITQTFDPEQENPLELQRDGWQAILNNFKTYTEAK